MPKAGPTGDQCILEPRGVRENIGLPREDFLPPSLLNRNQRTLYPALVGLEQYG